MPRVVRVVTEDLTVSAATVDAHADDLRSRHGATDAQIDAAQSGLPAGSAAALSGAVAKWQLDSTIHYTKMMDHGNGLRSGASAYATVDERTAARLDVTGPTLSLGL